MIVSQGKVVDQDANAIAFSVGLHNGNIHFLNQQSHFASFPIFPKISGDVEEDSLEKEGEANPLVVLMVPNLFPFSQIGIGSHSGMSPINAINPYEFSRNGVSGMNPTISVHNLKTFS